MMNTEDLLMPIAIAIIMLGIGFNVTVNSFKRVFIKPKGILTGLASQMLLLPAVAFLVAWLWPMDPIYKAGLVLVSACPGGTASNLVTHLLKGRVALSVSMTSFNSFLIIFTIPLILSLALRFFLGRDAEVEISFGSTIREVLSTVVFPVIVGMAVNHYFPDFTAKLKKPLRYILPAILLLVFALAIFGDSTGSVGGKIWNHANLFVPSLILNVATILIGYRVGRIVGIKHDGSFTIAIEMGLQNSALAIFIATSVLESSGIALMAVIYSSFTFFSTLGIAYMLKNRYTIPGIIYRIKKVS